MVFKAQAPESKLEGLGFRVFGVEGFGFRVLGT